MVTCFEVGVAFSRPPREDAVWRILVASEVDPSLSLARGLERAEVEAAETAYMMAWSHPRVVMPVRVDAVDVLEV